MQKFILTMTYKVMSLWIKAVKMVQLLMENRFFRCVYVLITCILFLKSQLNFFIPKGHSYIYHLVSINVQVQMYYVEVNSQKELTIEFWLLIIIYAFLKKCILKLFRVNIFTATLWTLLFCIFKKIILMKILLNWKLLEGRGNVQLITLQHVAKCLTLEGKEGGLILCL